MPATRPHLSAPLVGCHGLRVAIFRYALVACCHPVMEPNPLMSSPIPTEPTQQATDPAANVPAEPATPAAPSPADMPQAAPAPQTAPQPAAPQADDDPEGSEFDSETPDVRKMRRENKSLRDRMKAAEDESKGLAERLAELAEKANKTDALEGTLAKLAAVFNPAAAEEPVDPAKLAEQLAADKAAAEQAAAAQIAERDLQLRNLRVEQAAEKAARKAGVDVDALLDSRTFASTLAGLDPAGATFNTDLESAVAAALTLNPKLKTAPVAVRSGAEIAGRSGGTDQLTLEQVRGMKPEEVDAARIAGRLKSLLGGG